MGCFLFFLNHFAVKNMPRERSDRGRFCRRQLRQLYEADFHKPGIYGSGRVWANAWDVFRRAPSRCGRGRRAALDIMVCFGRGGFCSFFFFLDFSFFERTRPTASMRQPCLIYISTSNGSCEACRVCFFYFLCKCVFVCIIQYRNR